MNASFSLPSVRMGCVRIWLETTGVAVTVVSGLVMVARLVKVTKQATTIAIIPHVKHESVLKLSKTHKG